VRSFLLLPGYLDIARARPAQSTGHGRLFSIPVARVSTAAPRSVRPSTERHHGRTRSTRAGANRGRYLTAPIAATFTRIDAPALGTHVLYLAWRSNGPDGPISRQRLGSFRHDPTDGLRMAFHAFINGQPYAGRGGEPGALATVTKDALRGYGPACALRFELQPNGFTDAISAQECTITAASGRYMGINARVTLTADGTLEYQESGRLDDGRFAFRVPPAEPCRFRRVRRHRRGRRDDGHRTSRSRPSVASPSASLAELP
jgi:hypothetical protein